MFTEAVFIVVLVVLVGIFAACRRGCKGEEQGDGPETPGGGEGKEETDSKV